jgi:hypothetical protein
MSQSPKEQDREASLQRVIRDLEVEMQRLVSILVNDSRPNH